MANYITPVTAVANNTHAYQIDFYRASNVLDEDHSTHWITTDKSGDYYIDLALGGSKKLEGVRLSVLAAYVPATFDLLYSTDNVNWASWATGVAVNIADSWQDTTLTKITCSYVRIKPKSTINSGYYLISGVRFIEASGPTYKAAGSYISQPIDVSSETSITLQWDQTGATVAVKTALTDTITAPTEGDWQVQTNSSLITNPITKKYLWVKVLLSTTDTSSTPTFSNLRVLAGSDKYGIFTREGKFVAPIDHTHTAEITSIINGTLIDTNGKLRINLLPALAINDTWPVANEAAMLALDAQRGDVAIRADDEQSYILIADAPTVLANWLVLKAKAPGGASADGHTHVISDVVGLTTKMSELDTLKGAYESDLTTFLIIMNGGA